MNINEAWGPGLSVEEGSSEHGGLVLSGSTEETRCFILLCSNMEMKKRVLLELRNRKPKDGVPGGDNPIPPGITAYSPPGGRTGSSGAEERLQPGGRAPSVEADIHVAELVVDNCRSSDGEVEGLTESIGAGDPQHGERGAQLAVQAACSAQTQQDLDSLVEKCPNLTYLNLSGNKIKELSSIKTLQSLKHLKSLDLYSCEVSSLQEYRPSVFQLLPQIKYLDGYDPQDNELPTPTVRPLLLLLFVVVSFTMVRTGEPAVIDQVLFHVFTSWWRHRAVEDRGEHEEVILNIPVCEKITR
ncbi:Acidic leucine-rich nuclear phosphoprotein 32 family member E [Dissostichus eleginoides]|uniref:Acidic leucine-rich nuclear phosphoprotein 32 family member n=1 Tax=Dissostichus eleginoides TaxID=100907 RepID=A0AAD9C7N5_DISEL|nr:Acidic leucine-rich nuclear phosphoprotein 32 family member E [Dissostichus eleginoides]